MSEITNEDRRVAMATVYYYGYPELGDSLLKAASAAGMPQAEVTSLAAASRILLNDDDEFASLRLRRAIVKLAAGMLLTNDTDQVAELERAVIQLNGPISEINELELPDPLPTRQAVELMLYQLLADGGFAPECVSFPQTDVGYDLLEGSTIAYFRVITPRSFSTVARILDPQNWATCSIYFAASYVAHEDAGDFPLNGTGDALEDSTPPKTGTTWDRVLFEHFRFTDMWGLIVQFKNLLTIDANRSSDEFHYHYRLHTSISSGYGPMIFNGGLERDEGFVSGRKLAGGGTVVTGMKLLETDFITDPMVQFFLRQMADELAEILCKCNPPIVLGPFGMLLKILGLASGND